MKRAAESTSSPVNRTKHIRLEKEDALTELTAESFGAAIHRSASNMSLPRCPQKFSSLWATISLLVGIHNSFYFHSSRHAFLVSPSNDLNSNTLPRIQNPTEPDVGGLSLHKSLALLEKTLDFHWSGWPHEESIGFCIFSTWLQPPTPSGTQSERLIQYWSFVSRPALAERIPRSALLLSSLEFYFFTQ